MNRLSLLEVDVAYSDQNTTQFIRSFALIRRVFQELSQLPTQSPNSVRPLPHREYNSFEWKTTETAVLSPEEPHPES